MGNAEVALSKFEKSCSSSPNVPHFKINRACAFAALGRTEEALKDLAAAIQLDPNMRDVIREETDLAPLRSDRRFQELLQN